MVFGDGTTPIFVARQQTHGQVFYDHHWVVHLDSLMEIPEIILVIIIHLIYVTGLFAGAYAPNHRRNVCRVQVLISVLIRMVMENQVHGLHWHAQATRLRNFLQLLLAVNLPL